MNEIKFVKADGSETTIDSTVTDFKANVKFTDDDLTSSELIQFDEFIGSDGSIVNMIVLTLFASLGGKLNNANRLPVNIGFENFVDLMVTPRKSGTHTRNSLKYENIISFKNSNSVNTKFKLISGELPPGVNLPSEIGGTDLNLNGTVFDSVNVFDKSWAINSNENSNFNKESIFKSKVEFLNLTPSTGLFVGLGLSTKSGHHRIVESVDTYIEDSVTKTKVTVPYVIGTETDPKTLWYSKNTVYDERGVLTKNKDSTFFGQLVTTSGIYTYTDTNIVTSTENIQDQVTRDYNFEIGMYNGDTDALLTQESFSIKVYQNFDAVRDGFLSTEGLSGRNNYFPYLDTVSNYKLSLLKEDGTSTFILMDDNKLKLGETEIITTDGLLSLLLENGTTSNITLQPA